MPRSTNYTIFYLLLAVLCSCGDKVWRKLPEEKDIAFEGTAKKPPKSAYRPGQARDIQLDLTSSDAEAKEAKFKVVSWSVANGKKGTLDTASISLGSNTLHYTPQEPGTHELTLKVAVEGEENIQTLFCPIEAPAAEWQVAGRADREGHVTLTIADAPEAWQAEPWRITSTRWSRGLEGRIDNEPTQVQHGENTLPITLQEIALEALPQVHFTLQGPDRASQSITINLRDACIAQLEATYNEAHIQSLIDHNKKVRKEAATYQGNLTGNDRVDAQWNLNTLHETTTRLQRETNEQLGRLQDNISILLTGFTADLTVLNDRSVALRHALEGLNASMSRLQPMVDQLNGRDQGPIDPWGVLYEALQQGRYDAANMAPHLASPLLADAVNREDNQRKTLLHLAIEQGNLVLSRRLIRQGAELNPIDHAGHTPLHYAIEANNQEAITLLLGAGAVQDLQPDWQLQGNYEANGQQLVLTIGDTPGRLQQARDPQAQWRITNTTWSSGLNGQIDPDRVLQHGENRIALVINMDALTEAPTLHMLLQGPDRAFQSITLDLRKVCVARLQKGERGLIEREDNVNKYVQETETIYQLLPETLTDPRENRKKQTKVGTLLGQLEGFQTQYERDLQALSSDLNILEQAAVNELLPVFEANNKRLQDAIASLKSVQVQLQQQCTTAHEALFKTLTNRNIAAAEILSNDPKIDINPPVDWKNTNGFILPEDHTGNGWSLLHLAAVQGYATVVRNLLENGHQVDKLDLEEKITPLISASRKGHEDIVRILLEHGADTNAQGKQGQSALLVASLRGHERIVRILLENGADIDIRTSIKNTPLGMQVGGYTPLISASREGHEDIVRILLEHGADRNIISYSWHNGRPMTALEAAREKRYTSVANLLRTFRSD